MCSPLQQIQSIVSVTTPTTSILGEAFGELANGVEVHRGGKIKDIYACMKNLVRADGGKHLDVEERAIWRVVEYHLPGSLIMRFVIPSQGWASELMECWGGNCLYEESSSRDFIFVRNKRFTEHGWIRSFPRLHRYLYQNRSRHPGHILSYLFSYLHKKSS